MERSLADGGQDGAVSPVEMMAAALGACIGLMVNEYCVRNGYHDGPVSVFLHRSTWTPYKTVDRNP